MWSMNCGCNPVSNEQFEFNISSSNSRTTFYSNLSALLPKGNDSDIDNLECKTVQDYYDILNQLECGIQPDLEFLLEEISIIDMDSNCSFNIIKRIYSSDPDYDEDYLRRSKYLSEFQSESEKNRVLENLGVLDKLTEHVILNKEDYENLDTYKDDAIYFVIE